MKKLNQRGAVAAEFALLLPVLLTILFGIMEFGMIMYGREVVTNATRKVRVLESFSRVHPSARERSRP
jgi:uncharacterized protein (UPF0333 family)